MYKGYIANCYCIRGHFKLETFTHEYSERILKVGQPESKLLVSCMILQSPKVTLLSNKQVGLVGWQTGCHCEWHTKCPYWVTNNLPTMADKVKWQTTLFALLDTL